MISFIVIGRNEGKTIKNTINSIFTYVAYNKISNYEIIYVDSKSTDDSIDIVQNFKEVKIFEIIGEINAAIGRNIGAKEAKGDIFVFLDADMEIEKTFHDVIFKDAKLIYPFVSGQLKNIFYNDKWEVVDEQILFPKLKNDIFVPITGGYFIITKELWNSVEGMNTKYRSGEDSDFGLRLAQKGTLLLRKKELFVRHHTIHFQNEKRMWKTLFNGYFLYTTSLLYRDHLFNKYIFKILMRKDYTLVIYIGVLLSILFYPIVIWLYLLILILRVVFKRNVKENANLPKKFIYLLLKDIMVPFGFILFFPKRKDLRYRRIDTFE